MLSFASPVYAEIVDIRYQNPGSLVYDFLTFEVDGQPYVQVPSGCTSAAGVCVAAIDLGEGTHTVRGQAWNHGIAQWSGFSNTITVQGAPEPKASVGIMMGLALLASLRRRRRP